jgi:hypothetical protein
MTSSSNPNPSDGPWRTKEENRQSRRDYYSWLALHRTRQAAGLPPVTFISADQELNAAATAEGLAVDDPTTHP